ncbi:putative carbamoyl transferase, NodU family [Moorena producens 3L]|uniref:Putative carbamoyl transferase, NodU family n=1 Tax=Moorena producens 3L TaxID=489825 RepID=F4XQI7_9CYAN|nr:hypothetical protein [Moorena producens]EGJ33150.1 putative carbamoyl transferase, NodU family [Moorena producens 3L]OLT54194.1 hypothetical protein BI334_32930 [Moorena producens 3L]
MEKSSRRKYYEEIYIQPAAGDAGGSLGAALAAKHLYFNEPRKLPERPDSMKGSYLGPEYSEKEITLMNHRNKAESTKYDDFEKLTGFIASKISEGKVVGWVSGQNGIWTQGFRQSQHPRRCQK